MFWSEFEGHFGQFEDLLTHQSSLWVPLGTYKELCVEYTADVVAQKVRQIRRDNYCLASSVFLLNFSEILTIIVI